MEIIKSVTTEQVIKVVFTTGDGTPSDPARLICQYWDMDGNLIKENDSYTELYILIRVTLKKGILRNLGR